MSKQTQRAGAECPEPDAYTDPVAYLAARGWRCEGDPRRATGRWLDPTKPAVEVTERVRIGEKRLPGGETQAITQVNITPVAWPVSRDEAVAVQAERDEAARQ